jgi:predicted aminopeptidase
MKQSLNNANLALVATYHELVPALKAYLHEVDGDLPKFYQQMQELGRLPKTERHQKLARPDNK